MDWISSPEIWVSLLTLTSLEVVLGIDNIIFITILAGRLPVEQQAKARKLGLMGALVSRLALLSVISIIVKLDQPLFEAFGEPISWKSIILMVGGLFLLFKATKEIHHKLEGMQEEDGEPTKIASMGAVIGQVMVLDVIFSIDSVITAVGLTPYIGVMVAANIIALAVMLLASESIAKFVEAHPSLKVLALSFLLMIGLVLFAEGFGFHVPKGYVYFAMGFSVMVEFINIKSASRKRAARNQRS